ncbi:TPA: hypothetical protein KOR49_002300 [Clostridioides difficile]|uniref:Uncharacterized protein n=1 Tax=Clostridioides difficile TaxID=1496 RepID=A0AAN5VQF7_CLODI|nr:hypothetical protein [Clostridioides difficile]EGT3945689.1 hypothetical protein [Clostridioides difficile]MBG0199134.1 hypothetical protein [Clostridioides difficile]MCA0574494.1 hypothetical protein [Clostridioides difficile]MCM0739601.1 hypothetical protein [Clostridioides difficile]MDW0077093.1 hypothetical protein [Clostridioides difficile]
MEKEKIDKQEVINKKLKKVIEEIIIQEEDYFADKFDGRDFKEIKKHKNQVSQIVLTNELLVEYLRAFIVDGIDMYYYLKKK